MNTAVTVGLHCSGEHSKHEGRGVHTGHAATSTHCLRAAVHLSRCPCPRRWRAGSAYRQLHAAVLGRCQGPTCQQVAGTSRSTYSKTWTVFDAVCTMTRAAPVSKFWVQTHAMHLAYLVVAKAFAMLCCFSPLCTNAQPMFSWSETGVVSVGHFGFLQQPEDVSPCLKMFICCSMCAVTLI